METVPLATDSLGKPLRSRENRFRRVFLLIFVLGISALFLSMIRSFLLTILLAAIFTGLGYPLFTRLVTLMRGRRPLAALATIFIGAFLLVAPVAVVIYMVTLEALRLSENVRPWIQQISAQPSTLAP